MNHTLPYFSVIIPTCHRNEDLSKCLSLLDPQHQINPPEYEVIVSDDGSLTTSEFLIKERFPWVKWTPGSRRGPAANRNNGARLAKGEWLVFTDDDCLPNANWLEAYKLHSTKTKVLEGLTMAERPQTRLDEESPFNLTGGCLWSCNFAIRKDFFESIGGFDEDFPAPAMEDCDLRERIKTLGHPFLFCPDAVVIHPWRPRKNKGFHAKYRVAYLYFLEKHPHFRNGNPGWKHIMVTLKTYIKTMINEGPKVGFRGFFNHLDCTVRSLIEGIKMLRH